MNTADSELIKGFTRDQLRRGLEPTTIEVRRNKLRHFGGWLEPRSLLAATQEDIEAFLDDRGGRSGRGLEARTRYAWISHLHCFYVWAMRTGHIERDPTAWIVRPKLRRLLPRPIGDEDLAAALCLAGRRHRAMLMLGAYAGLRCKEIAELRREDVLDTYQPPRLMAHGKGSTDRFVPLHPHVLEGLRRLPMPSRGPIFLHPRTGAPMTPGQVSAEMTAFFDGLGMAERFHQLRHWFGTRVQDEIGDLRVTQELMGHASPNTTAGYAAFSSKKAVEAVMRLTIRRSEPDDEALFTVGR